MKFFDSHAHLDDEKFNEDREELLEQIYREGIEKFVSAGYNIESSKKSIELSKKYNLYRQNYCGCIYSKRAEEEKKEKDL